MTATEVGSPSTDLSLGDLVNSVVDTAVDDTATDPVIEAGGDVPGGEGPTPVEGPGEAMPSTPPGEGPTSASPYQLNEEGTAYIVPKAELPQLTGAKEYATQVQELFPTFNDANAAATEQGDWRLMRSDFVAGGDQQLKQILGFFLGNGTNDLNEKFQYQNSFAKMAEMLPSVLKSFNDPNRPGFGQQAYEKLATNILSDRIEQKYKDALEQGDVSNAQDPLLLEAQQFEWLIKGTYRTNDAALQQQFRVNGIQPVNKQDIEAQQAQQRNQQILAREKQNQDRDFVAWNKSSLDGAKWKAFDEQIAATLAPIKDKYDPKIFAAVQRQIRDEVIQAVQQDGLFSRNHSSDRAAIEANYRHIWSQMQNPDALNPHAQTYINNFLARAKKYLPSIAAPILKNATAAAVARPVRPQSTSPARPRAVAANGTQQEPAYQGLADNPEWKAMFKPFR